MRILWLLPLLAACNEQGINEQRIDTLAVVLGDFDYLSGTLVSLGIATTDYDGFIVQATYEPEEGRDKRGESGYTVEGLLSNTDTMGRIELDLYQAAFFNSGTRGLNAWIYNDPLTADDSLLKDETKMQVVCDYVQNGNTLVVSDWDYDLVEYCWPDAVEFVGDDAVVDAAQVGEAGTDVLATVEGDDAFKKAVGADVVSLNYNYSAWAVIESVGKDTEVLLSGDVSYQPSAAELPEMITGVPLLVRFKAGNGSVVFSTFHWTAQNQGVAQGLLLGAVPGLTPKSADTSGGSSK
jgi:hypothetical protein